LNKINLNHEILFYWSLVLILVYSTFQNYIPENYEEIALGTASFIFFVPTEILSYQILRSLLKRTSLEIKFLWFKRLMEVT